MPSGKITKTAVDDLKAMTGSAGKLVPNYLWDIGLAGFGVKATPGGRKVYVVQYRVKDSGRAGKVQRVTLGTHGAMTADTARDRAKAVLGKIADGADPAAEKRQKKREDRTAPTIAQVAADFVASKREKAKPSTMAEYERLISKLIVPGIGERLVRDVIKGDVKRWHTSLSGTKTQANRALALLSTIFNSAIDDGYRPDRVNPCEGVERYAETARQRYLSEKELAALSDALNVARTKGIAWEVDETKAGAKHLAKPENRFTRIDQFAAASILLYVFIGARRGEILKLKWSEVDLEAGVIRLTDHKTSRTKGVKTIPLNAPARAVLAGLPRLDGNPFVIPGNDLVKEDGEIIKTHRTDLKRPWNAVRALAGLDDVHLHDLRHTVGATAVASNVSLRLITGLLGHASEKTSARYAHLSTTPVQEAAEKVGQRIAEAMGIKTPNAADKPSAELVRPPQFAKRS